MDKISDQQFDSGDMEALKIASSELDEPEGGIKENTPESSFAAESWSRIDPLPSEKGSIFPKPPDTNQRSSQSLLSKLSSFEGKVTKVDQELAETESRMASLSQQQKRLEEKKEEFARIQEKCAALEREIDEVLIERQEI